MKKTILALSFIAFVSVTTVSCSTDDSALNNDTNATELSTGTIYDNGDKDLPKPPIKNT
jgi:hypothetical protein